MKPVKQWDDGFRHDFPCYITVIYLKMSASIHKRHFTFEQREMKEADYHHDYRTMHVMSHIATPALYCGSEFSLYSPKQMKLMALLDTSCSYHSLVIVGMKNIAHKRLRSFSASYFLTQM
jgi:hypothetical protein